MFRIVNILLIYHNNIHLYSNKQNIIYSQIKEIVRNMKSIRKDDNALLFQLLVGAGMAVIIFFAIMNIGTFINSTIAQELTENLGTTTEFGGRGTNTLRNLSTDYDNVIDSLAIAAVVMAITLPLAAVVAIRKFF